MILYKTKICIIIRRGYERNDFIIVVFDKNSIFTIKITKTEMDNCRETAPGYTKLTGLFTRAI